MEEIMQRSLSIDRPTPFSFFPKLWLLYPLFVSLSFIEIFTTGIYTITIVADPIRGVRAITTPGGRVSDRLNHCYRDDISP